jgi:hypothetical protein
VAAPEVALVGQADHPMSNPRDKRAGELAAARCRLGLGPPRPSFDHLVTIPVATARGTIATAPEAPVALAVRALTRRAGDPNIRDREASKGREAPCDQRA